MLLVKKKQFISGDFLLQTLGAKVLEIKIFSAFSSVVNLNSAYKDGTSYRQPETLFTTLGRVLNGKDRLRFFIIDLLRNNKTNIPK